MTQIGGFFVFIVLIVNVLTSRVVYSDDFEFDENFIRILHQNLTDAERILIANAIIEPKPEYDNKVTAPQKKRQVDILIEIFKSFLSYANEFERNVDRTYANIGDFRAVYLHEIGKLDWLAVQAEAYRNTTENESYRLQNVGGGVGLRVGVETNKSGALGLSFLPFYGERRSVVFRYGADGSTSLFTRVSLGASYVYTGFDAAQPGVQILYQPQIIDLGQFRVYAEAFIRFKIVRSSTGKNIKISQISLVPKVIYARSNDRESSVGENIDELGKNFSAFCNVEIGFKL